MAVPFPFWVFWRDTSSPDHPSTNYVPHLLVISPVQTRTTRNIPTPFIPLGRGFGHEGWLGISPGFDRGGLLSARGPYRAPVIPTTKDVLNTLTLLKRMYRRLPDALMAQWVSGPRGLVATTGY